MVTGVACAPRESLALNLQPARRPALSVHATEKRVLLLLVHLFIRGLLAESNIHDEQNT